MSDDGYRISPPPASVGLRVRTNRRKQAVCRECGERLSARSAKSLTEKTRQHTRSTTHQEFDSGVLIHNDVWAECGAKSDRTYVYPEEAYPDGTRRLSALIYRRVFGTLAWLERRWDR